MAKDLPVPDDLDFKAHVVNCTTGEEFVREFSDEERTDAIREWWEGVGAAVELTTAAAAAAEKRAATAAALAKAAGLKPEDVIAVLA